MKLVQSLSAIALIGAAVPAAHALSIKDDVVSVGLGVRLQTRMTMADATTGGTGATAGEEFRVQGGVAGAVNDPADFGIRRARMYLNIKYGANWKGQLGFQADNIDVNGTDGTTRNMAVRYAWLERQIKMGDSAHGIHFGLDKPYNNPSDSAMSSSRELAVGSNRASQLLNPRGVGVGYRFNHPVFLLAADVQNNTSPKDTAALNAEEEEGFFYGARAEFSFSPEWFIAKRAESFCGQEGTGFNIGLSYGVNDNAVLADADPLAGTQPGQRTIDAYSLDVMFHFHAISAYAEYRVQTQESTRNDNVSVADVESEVILFQGGYAFALENGTVIEPAVRFQMIDNNTDVDENVSYSASGTTAEVGNSGEQIDFGLNYYLDGHNNKLQLFYQMWSAEEGDGDANIIRLQHQLNF